jgi:hypothetical protein
VFLKHLGYNKMTLQVLNVKFGGMADWLCSGLQIRGSRFDSGFRLHYVSKTNSLAVGQTIYYRLVTYKSIQCPGGEIGRHKGFKIPRS